MQKFKEILNKILEQIKQIFMKLKKHDECMQNHEERIKQLENKKKRIKCGGNGPRVTIADVLVEMRNGFSQVNYRLDNIEADVKDLKVRVTKLEDDNVKLKAELKAEMVQLLDERDKKWEAKFDEMNNSFEGKVVKILDKHLDKRDANFEEKVVKILDKHLDKRDANFEDKVVKVIKKFNKSEKN